MNFNVDEVFTIAEQIERNGATFYRKAVKFAKDTAIKRQLLELAKMEDSHEKSFAGMHSAFTGDKKSLVFDSNSEAATYLEAFAGDYVFNLKSNPADKIGGHHSIKNVLKLAITLEKDSIVFYLGVAKVMLDDNNRQAIEAIIDQELQHIALLSAILRKNS